MRIDPRIIIDPPRSNWSWSFGPDFSIRWTPALGDEPNAFHRWMQRVCLGIYWRKDK